MVRPALNRFACRLLCLRICLMLMTLVMVGCSSTPTAPSAPSPGSSSQTIEFPPATTPPPVSVSSRLTPQQATDVTIYAIGLVGTPYRFGGNTPEGGFDCSGLIGHVYQKRAAILAPRTVSRLQNWGQSVPVHELRSGDLVIFGRGSHAGIYVGENRFVHAPSTGGEVRLDSLRSKYWAQQQVAFRRP